MDSKIVLLFLIINFQNSIICDNNNAKMKLEKEDVFVPTHEWQVIKEGQSIPKGLHVRINIQTGLKEAKLLDTSEQSTESHKNEQRNKHALLEIPGEENKEIKETNSNINSYSPKELKKLLQNIKSDENLAPTDKSDLKRVKEKFKDYEQLKKELSDLNLSVKTDSEILRDLFSNFKDVISNKNLNSDEKDAEIMSILINFEYLVHQIDNANEFINLNGFTEIIYKNLNSSNTEIKSETLNVLGSCVQNNVKAQINALESGAIDIVLRLLAIDSTNSVKMRAVYSLSSLLRRFPIAQKHFMKNGGLNVFSKIFSTSENIKLQLKIITLIYDLLIEQKESELDENRVDFQEKLNQYKTVDMKDNLIKNDWCTIFNNILINVANLKERNHDAVEICLNVMLLVSDSCSKIFYNKNLLNTLKEFYNFYNYVSEEEDVNDPYFTTIKNTTHLLLSTISSVKTEL